MTPEEYEHCVAGVLRARGWDARVSKHRRDFGIDIVAERDGRCLGVQVKMFGGATRAVAGRMVMELYGAATYADSDKALWSPTAGSFPIRPWSAPPSGSLGFYYPGAARALNARGERKVME